MTARRSFCRRLAALATVPAILVGVATVAAATEGPGPNRSYQISSIFSAGGGPAITYAPDTVPVGAGVTVDTRSGGGVTTTVLRVRGLRPGTVYGAHAHVGRCGATGDAAGPHFQFRPDPVQPSVDPAYANPRNEIWLDLRTDAHGDGSATSTNPWVFPAERRAGSVVLHEMATSNEPGHAGTAGGRLACVTVAF